MVTVSDDCDRWWWMACCARVCLGPSELWNLGCNWWSLTIWFFDFWLHHQPVFFHEWFFPDSWPLIKEMNWGDFSCSKAQIVTDQSSHSKPTIKSRSSSPQNFNGRKSGSKNELWKPTPEATVFRSSPTNRSRKLSEQSVRLEFSFYFFSSTFSSLTSLTSHHITSLHITTSHHITSHHFTSPLHITSHHITSHHITSHHITSHHITSHYITSHHITSHHITSDHITSPHITSHHITSHHITINIHNQHHNQHSQSAFTINIHDHHSQSSFTVIIHNQYSQSTFTTIIHSIIHNQYSQASFRITIRLIDTYPSFRLLRRTIGKWTSLQNYCVFEKTSFTPWTSMTFIKTRLKTTMGGCIRNRHSQGKQQTPDSSGLKRETSKVVQSPFANIIDNRPSQSSFTIIIQAQSIFTIVIYDHHSKSAFTIIIHSNRHSQSAFIMNQNNPTSSPRRNQP